jgi:hypothetical protein
VRRFVSRRNRRKEIVKFLNARGRRFESPYVDSYKLGWGVWCVLLNLFALSSFAAVSISKTNYHGWADSFVIGNEAAEVVVAPKIGRVMQFRFAGEPEGPFFENRATDGKTPIPTSSEWGNFGGDKSWPSPQDDWGKVTGRGWPPPMAFDSMPVEAKVEGTKLRLMSAVDPHYGIRTERLISLEEAGAKMTIVTTYHKVEGKAQRVGVWIITQLGEPEFVYIPTYMGDKFVRQSETLPQNLKVGKDAITLKRNPAKSAKIGTDASALIWVGKKSALRIESPRGEGEYPDKGSSAEVYTNPNPLTYVELEILGPLKTMELGDKISQTNVYSLLKREELEKTVVQDVK